MGGWGVCAHPPPHKARDSALESSWSLESPEPPKSGDCFLNPGWFKKPHASGSSGSCLKRAGLGWWHRWYFHPFSPLLTSPPETRTVLWCVCCQVRQGLVSCLLAQGMVGLMGSPGWEPYRGFWARATARPLALQVWVSERLFLT